MSLKDKSRMQFHPLSNGLIIGSKRPVLMIDVPLVPSASYNLELIAHSCIKLRIIPRLIQK